MPSASFRLKRHGFESFAVTSLRTPETCERCIALPSGPVPRQRLLSTPSVPFEKNSKRPNQLDWPPSVAPSRDHNATVRPASPPSAAANCLAAKARASTMLRAPTPCWSAFGDSGVALSNNLCAPPSFLRKLGPISDGLRSIATDLKPHGRARVLHAPEKGGPVRRPRRPHPISGLRCRRVPEGAGMFPFRTTQ